MNYSLVDVEAFAQDIFKNKTRLNGENLAQHGVDVKNRLVKIGITNKLVLSAALLHDIKKAPNTNELLNKIEKKFDPSLKQVLEQYIKTTETKIKINTPSATNINYIMQAFINLASNLNVLIIMLADKTENSTTMHVFDKEERERAANRALNVYSPLCKFLGLSEFSEEIESNAFKILFPQEYIKITKHLEENQTVTKIYLDELKVLIKEYLAENGINAEVSRRIKKPYSIHKKIVRKHAKSILEISDIAALRVLVNNEQHCYKVETLLANLWKENLKERDDYIAKPKPNGYKSINTYYFVEEDSPIEVQIRTKEMHEYNEYGQASHIFYKMGPLFKKYNVNDAYWLKEIEFGKKYEPTQLEQFSNFVYVFTPKGDIIELPKGATPIDFAYEIHDSVGDRCKGVLVNDKIKKLSYELQNGDRVTVRIAHKKTVNADWLKYAQTHKAKRNIRRELRNNA